MLRQILEPLPRGEHHQSARSLHHLSGGPLATPAGPIAAQPARLYGHAHANLAAQSQGARFGSSAGPQASASLATLAPQRDRSAAPGRAQPGRQPALSGRAGQHLRGHPAGPGHRAPLPAPYPGRPPLSRPQSTSTPRMRLCCTRSVEANGPLAVCATATCNDCSMPVKPETKRWRADARPRWDANCVCCAPTVCSASCPILIATMVTESGRAILTALVAAQEASTEKLTPALAA